MRREESGDAKEELFNRLDLGVMEKSTDYLAYDLSARWMVDHQSIRKRNRKGFMRQRTFKFSCLYN